MRSIFQHTLARYLLIGLLNTFVGLGIIFFLKWAVSFSDILANLCGYIIGFIVSFFLNKNWTFQFQGANHITVLKFALLVILAYVANLAIVVFTVGHWEINGYIAQAMGIFPYTAINYLGSKYWVFRARQGPGII